MYVPTGTVWDQLHSAPHGLWVDRPEGGSVVFALKLSTNALKFLYRDRHAVLRISLIRCEDVLVRCLGFQVNDDPAFPLTTYATQWQEDKQHNLEEVLCAGRVRIYLYDELSRCVGVMSCSMGKDESEAAAKRLRGIPQYVGLNRNVREAALNVFQQDLEAENLGQPLQAEWNVCLPLVLEGVQTNTIYGFTSEGASSFRLDDDGDNAEGHGLEQSGHLLLHNTFQDRLFRSPQIDGPTGRIELCDLLGISEEGIVIVQAGVDAVLSSESVNTMDKRVRRMNRAVLKGIRQTGGAIRTIRSTTPIFKKSGEQIDVAADQTTLINAIVLISDMMAGMNWTGFANEVRACSKKYNACYNVLDLVELRLLVGVSDRSDLLHLNLAKRCVAVVEGGNAYVRSRVPPSATQTQ